MARPTGKKARDRSRSDMHKISYERNCAAKTPDTIRSVVNKRDEKLAEKRIRQTHRECFETGPLAMDLGQSDAPKIQIVGKDRYRIIFLDKDKYLAYHPLP